MMDGIYDDIIGVTGKCLSELSQSGFDADAFEISRISGILILALSVLLFTIFFLRKVLYQSSLEFPVSDNLFGAVMLIGAVLIALPVISKFAIDESSLDISSADSSFARQYCSSLSANPDRDAEINSLVSSVSELSKKVITLENKTGSGVDAQRPPLFLSSIAIFPRSNRTGDANKMAAILRDNGAGVSIVETDLSEARIENEPGDSVLVYEQSTFEEAQRITEILSSNNIKIDTSGPHNLRGKSLQILLF